MFISTAPSSFLRSSEGRVASTLLAVGIGLTACGGSGDTQTSAAAESGATSSPGTGDQNCETGQVIDGPNGTKLYCEELQARSADVFRDVTDLFNSQIPGQLHVGQTVLVRCVQAAALEFAPSANGNPGDTHSEWYVLDQPDTYTDGYTAANDFWNVDPKTKEDYIKNHTPLNQQPAVDPQVPSCGPPIEK